MKSEDSPGSSISVSLSVNAEWEPIPNMLCFAKDRVDTVERCHNASSLVREVLRGLQKLCNNVQDVARIHPISQVAYVFLYALYRTVEKQVDLDNEIKALIQLMRDVLVHIEQYRNAHGTQEENEVFGVIKVLAEGAASIDEWNHVPAIQRAARAPQLIVALQTCKKQLEELKQKHTVKSVPGGIGLRDRCV
ncbi:hypothetical protein PHLGIDRAFT_163006 [Phlebiopsis gigantea 11061_1 CR5-6]|uniref:Fungal STAND N-terminal Goodbye domain-containing protein n=1 Tax=Phlebiopsis gigantea (strain 11061_1 CR5-6) TaxID=745531 RepID=A0A0C3PH82_PHLG1|nr:hypothetical protein PHLGIDRAFT_163006 [Phlebiopsis gigantea 11061_1 CR5-6]